MRGGDASAPGAAAHPSLEHPAVWVSARDGGAAWPPPRALVDAYLALAGLASLPEEVHGGARPAPGRPPSPAAHPGPGHAVDVLAGLVGPLDEAALEPEEADGAAAVARRELPAVRAPGQAPVPFGRLDLAREPAVHRVPDSHPPVLPGARREHVAGRWVPPEVVHALGVALEGALRAVLGAPAVVHAPDARRGVRGARRHHRPVAVPAEGVNLLAVVGDVLRLRGRRRGRWGECLRVGGPRPRARLGRRRSGRAPSRHLEEELLLLFPAGGGRHSRGHRRVRAVSARRDGRAFPPDREAGRVSLLRSGSPGRERFRRVEPARLRGGRGAGRREQRTAPAS